MFAFANICGNVIYVIIYTFYFGPSCIFQDFLFPGGKNNFFPGFLTYLAHGHSIQDFLIQDAVSFNRLTTVIYPKSAYWFSKRVTIGIIIFAYVFGYLISWFADYYLPCCKFYLYYDGFSYAILDTDYNVANIFVNTPVNFVTSGFAVINYLIMYIFVHISNRKMTKFVSKSTQRTRKIREIKYAFQFALCTFCGIATWVSFRVFSLFGIPRSPVYFILTTFQILNASVNSIIFLIFNKDIQKQFKYRIMNQDVVESTIPARMSIFSHHPNKVKIAL
ncbi:hypothetical protein FO519_009817 [Halicephalobus sp. NKZ332]|nr:hypothetical protein FO519_009817 [Halicephalobus sp. NKZ332]